MEVVGKLAREGARRVLADALIRPAKGAVAAEILTAWKNTVGRVEQIRELSAEEAAQGREVELQGTVAWEFPNTDFSI